MPRPSIDLELYRLQIIEWRNAGLSMQAIIQQLEDTYYLKVSRHTLWRAITKWDVPIRQPTEDSEVLRQRIKELFFDVVLNDHFMFLQLQSEGFTVTRRGLTRIRREMGLARRQTHEQIALRQQELKEFFEESAKKSTVVEGLGRTYLYAYVRQRYHIISRHALYETYREVFPTQPDERRRSYLVSRWI